MTMYEASDAYPDGWILMCITGRNDELAMLVGEVIEHNPSRAAINRAVKRVRKQDWDACLAVFPGGMRQLKGD